MHEEVCNDIIYVKQCVHAGLRAEKISCNALFRNAIGL